MNRDFILETKSLSKEYRGLLAVDNVSLQIKRGSIHALIGPNGAGKTTCFQLLTRFIQPSKGQILYNGKDITELDPASVARMGMVRSFQISSIFPNTSVIGNIRLALQTRRGNNFDFYRSDKILSTYNDEAFHLANMFALDSEAKVPAGALPYGKRRALELATTFAMNPDLLLLDEPTSGMGHEDVERITQLIQQAAANRTVLIVEHNLKMVESLSDRVTVLARGSVLAEGDYETVAADKRVLQAYIGDEND